MSKFLRKSILFGHFGVRALALTSNVYHLTTRSFSIISELNEKHSFTVAYLINSFGFSQNKALLASKYVNFETSEKPDKAVQFFESYGFAMSQITALISGFPAVLVWDTEKIILPKLEFLQSKGISGPEMAKRLSVYPSILRASLADKIMPSYEFLRDFFQSDEKTIIAFRRYPNILGNDSKHVSSNIDILREYGVSDFNIGAFLQRDPRYFTAHPDSLREAIEEVTKTGLSSSKPKFVEMALCIGSMGKSRWDVKVNAYKKWGWSEEDVWKAFEKNTRFMQMSERRITAKMEFFISRMGLRPCLLAECPTLITYSLEMRIIPRVSFYQALVSKGLLEKELHLSTIVMASEKKFLHFAAHYAKMVPELFELHEDKLRLSSRPESDSCLRALRGK